MSPLSIRSIATLLGSVSLAACATLPQKMEHAAPRPLAGYATQQSLAAPAAAWPQDRWWDGYGDPQLGQLIDEALRGAPDLRAARARLLKARAIASQADAAQLPTIDANASLQELRQSYNQGMPAPRGWNESARATLDFNWELDFWGKNRAAFAAATSEAQAAEAESVAARLALSTAIGGAYADLSALFADRAATAGALGVRTRTLALIRERREQGLENDGAVQRALSAQESAAAELAAIDETIVLTRNRIAALLGEGPDRGLAIAAPKVLGRGAVGLPADVRADLLGRRPDVIAARLRTEAAASRIKVAKAGFYPSINLGAFVGLSSLGLDLFAKSGAFTASAGPAISLPIFSGGELRGRYREAEADYDLAVAQYDGAVTEALRQVADAAASGRALAVRLARAEAAERAAAGAWTVANNRYRGGLATYLDVLTAEDALIASRRTLAGLQSRAFTLDVALVRALGGGFRTDMGATS